jgi:catechol 2,3-dioxygenase
MSMTTSAPAESTPAIDPRTTMGTVHLTVSNLDRSRAFYEQSIGLRSTELADGEIALGPADGPTLVQLHGDSAAPALDRSATGLFHLAILVPSRLDLAFALARLSTTGWPLDGASDHLVSEALYLSDPDGNGIEIYRDRPREEWQWVDGRLQMATLRLDLNGVAGELNGASELQEKAPAGTTIGHVHLQVAELAEIEAFYADLLGFDVVVRGYPGALFVSAGGYHHHLGLNTWNSGGGPAPHPGAIGLRHYEIVLPGEQALSDVLGRVSAAGVPTEAVDELVPGGHRLRDPSGNALVLRTAAPAPTA